MSHDPHETSKHHEHTAEAPVLHDAPDAWHDHSHDEQPQQAHAEVGNAKAITAIGVGLFMVIVFAVVAVYAYYTWFLARQLHENEVATSRDPLSPSVMAVQYKRDSLRRLEVGGSVDVPEREPAPAMKYTVTPIEDSIKRVARTYAAPAR